MNQRKLTTGDVQVIGQLLVEVLGAGCAVSSETRQANLELQEQLRVTSVMLIEKQI